MADENIDGQVVAALRAEGHEVTYIAELAPGIDDEAVLSSSVESEAVLVTADKDFGELAYRQRRAMNGVLLIRLAGLTASAKSSRITSVIRLHGVELEGAFAVVTHNALRVRRGAQ